jgi:hypothetical protein
MAVQDTTKVKGKPYRIEDLEAIPSTTETKVFPRISGAVSSAFLSSGIGCLLIGLMTTGAVISETLNHMLNWWGPAGPLTGKTSIGVAGWLISWFVLNSRWRNKEVDFGKIFAATLILIGVGFLLTFPPIFEAFE